MTNQPEVELEAVVELKLKIPADLHAAMLVAARRDDRTARMFIIRALRRAVETPESLHPTQPPIYIPAQRPVENIPGFPPTPGWPLPPAITCEATASTL